MHVMCSLTCTSDNNWLYNFLQIIETTGMFVTIDKHYQANLASYKRSQYHNMNTCSYPTHEGHLL